MQEEIWKDITGFEFYYQVSNLGRVKRKENTKFQKSKVLKPSLHTKGYTRVNLRKNNKTHTIFIHRIVAIEFISNPFEKPQINHIDGIKTNNHSSNLEWVTNSENQKHSVKTGLRRTKLTNHAVVDIKANHIKRKTTSLYFSKKYNVSRSCIDCVVNNKTWVREV